MVPRFVHLRERKLYEAVVLYRIQAGRASGSFVWVYMLNFVQCLPASSKIWQIININPRKQDYGSVDDIT